MCNLDQNSYGRAKECLTPTGSEGRALLRKTALGVVDVARKQMSPVRKLRVDNLEDGAKGPQSLKPHKGATGGPNRVADSSSKKDVV